MKCEMGGVGHAETHRYRQRGSQVTGQWKDENDQVGLNRKTKDHTLKKKEPMA